MREEERLKLIKKEMNSESNRLIVKIKQSIQHENELKVSKEKAWQ